MNNPKRIALTIFLASGMSLVFAQKPEEAEKLVAEGVEYHDKGDFTAAILRYDRALLLDKDNLLALTEKAFSLLSQKKYEESIECCERALKIHAKDENLATVYVTYGNATDGLKKTEKAIDIYNEGIKKFPGYYQLHYNKGISLASQQKYDEGILSFQKAVMCNPKHASSHNAIARLTYMQNKKIPALLAYCRFMSLEPGGKRAGENLTNLRAIVKGSAKKTGENEITVNFDPDASSGKGRKNKDDFSAVDLLLQMTSALDHDEKNKNNSEIQNFSRKLSTVATSMSEMADKNSGFFWEYYAPYLMDMEKNKHTETFSYIAFSSTDDAEASAWLKENKGKVQEFLQWSKEFKWKTLE